MDISIAAATLESRKPVTGPVHGLVFVVGGQALRLAAAMFLLGPAAIHFAVVPEHLREYAPYGVFFALLGLGQIALAFAVLWRPSPGLVLGGAAALLAVICVWLMSRTVGLPLAPIPWRPEAIGVPDLTSTFMEWAASILLILADWRLERVRRFALAKALPGLTPALILSAGTTLAGLAAVGTTGGH